jgi:hypothetical protein
MLSVCLPPPPPVCRYVQGYVTGKWLLFFSMQGPLVLGEHAVHAALKRAGVPLPSALMIPITLVRGTCCASCHPLCQGHACDVKLACGSDGFVYCRDCPTYLCCWQALQAPCYTVRDVGAGSVLELVQRLFACLLVAPPLQAVLLGTADLYFFPPCMESGLADRVVASIRASFETAISLVTANGTR